MQGEAGEDRAFVLSADHDPVWDRAVYAEIADLLGPVRAGEALRLFEASLQAGLALMRRMPDDCERIAREAHALIAAAGMLGFTDLSRASRSLMEHDFAEQPGRESRGLIQDLEAAAVRTLDWIRRSPRAPAP